MSQSATSLSKPSWRLLAVAGWAASIIGFAAWIYGYSVPGTPSLIQWSAFLPRWTADTLPNLEWECGMVLSLLGNGMVLWTSSAHRSPLMVKHGSTIERFERGDV